MALRENARELRKNATREENHLWYDFLREYKVQFYRQRIVEPYILDFYCPRAKLAIELDGGQHYEQAALEKDAKRTAYLNGRGIEVLRITTREIWQEFQAVCAAIDHAVQERYHPI